MAIVDHVADNITNPFPLSFIILTLLVTNRLLFYKFVLVTMV